MTSRHRAKAVLTTCALVGSGMAALLVAAPAGAAPAPVAAPRTLTVFGGFGNDTIVVSRDVAGDILVNGRSVRSYGVRATVTDTDLIRVFGGFGNDTISLDETNGTLPRADLFGGFGNDHLTGSSAADRLYGGAGNDTLTGGRGNEFLSGGDGNDFVDGNQGADTVQLGYGNDTFQWDPGDGSDVVDGDQGHDTMIFNGANTGESFDVSASGGRVLFTRNVGTISMNLDGIEHIDTNALGGVDAFTAHDLTGTGVTDLELNEASTTGAADGSADRITVEGTTGPDSVVVRGSAATGVSVDGLAATVHVTGTDPFDLLGVQTFGGSDTVDSTQLAAGLVTFSVNGVTRP